LVLVVGQALAAQRDERAVAAALGQQLARGGGALVGAALELRERGYF
jgi:hypothetical protein